MKTDTSIYTHYAKIKRCIESCETFYQTISCYNMLNNMITMHGYTSNEITIYDELHNLLRFKIDETKHI